MKKVRVTASFLAIALTITSVCVSVGTIDAAKKPKLNKSKVTVKVGETVKLKVKNGNKKAKIKWKSSKKSIATVNKGKKSSATVKGIAEGKTKVTATYKFKSKKFKLKCNVTVDKAGNASAGTANTPGAGTAAPSAASGQSGIENTKAPDNNNEPENTPTKKPAATKRPTPTKTPVPSPSPTPYLVNPYKVDLSTVKTETDGVPDRVCDVKYNEETKSLDATMDGWAGFIVRSPITDRKDEYKYVKVTYNLNSAGDVNIYAGQYDATTGETGTGWSPEIKLNQYDMDKETTLILGSYDYLNGEPLGAVKIFNFGDVTNISITDITFYMDGDKSEEIPGPDASASPDTSAEPKPNEVDFSAEQPYKNKDGDVTAEYSGGTYNITIPQFKGIGFEAPADMTCKYIEITYTSDSDLNTTLFDAGYQGSTDRGKPGEHSSDQKEETPVLKKAETETTLKIEAGENYQGNCIKAIKIAHIDFDNAAPKTIKIKSIKFFEAAPDA